MNRIANATLAVALAAVVATVAARPAMAEPDPIDLDRLPNVPVQLWRDVNANGSHDSADSLIASTSSSFDGQWQFNGLATNQTHRLLIVRLDASQQGIRIGGDLYRFNGYAFSPIDGISTKLLSDSGFPSWFFGSNDAQIASDTTHCAGNYKCGDYRLQSTATSFSQGIVLALSGSAASYSGYTGWLWDATLDND